MNVSFSVSFYILTIQQDLKTCRSQWCKLCMKLANVILFLSPLLFLVEILIHQCFTLRHSNHNHSLAHVFSSLITKKFQQLYEKKYIHAVDIALNFAFLFKSSDSLFSQKDLLQPILSGKTMLLCHEKTGTQLVIGAKREFRVYLLQISSEKLKKKILYKGKQRLK